MEGLLLLALPIRDLVDLERVSLSFCSISGSSLNKSLMRSDSFDPFGLRVSAREFYLTS
jgi:hypothetical protein